MHCAGMLLQRNIPRGCAPVHWLQQLQTAGNKCAAWRSCEPAAYNMLESVACSATASPRKLGCCWPHVHLRTAARAAALRTEFDTASC